MSGKRLAIIGGGSSGLISLKYALEELPDWEIVCYEKTSDVTGCWGRPPRGFVSTSTRYATHFACYRQYDAVVAARDPSGGNHAANPEFFCDGQYGEYLEGFLEAFDLDRHIRRNCPISQVVRTNDGAWQLTVLNAGDETVERFDAVIICTGLADQPQPLTDCPVRTLRAIDEANRVTNQRVVVMGGGESAVDLARRLAAEDRRNDVYLSLRSGIRVSPRYHPIRGVPSDFLRNRLLLSIHPDLRNWLGQKFVEFRIRSEQRLRRWFPGRQPAAGSDSEALARRKAWDMRLTLAAKDQLFNVYHNKSDDFLDDVAAGRIQITGPPVDSSYRDFRQFESEQTLSVDPDLVVPAVGYRSTLADLSAGAFALEDFYLGCVHATCDNLFLVGFTRPIIGNIPSISEMQARLASGLLSGRWARPENLAEAHQRDRLALRHTFPRLDTVNVYPVEMFPYCDRLARWMGCYPTVRDAGSLFRWARLMLEPATTLHYFPAARQAAAPIHAPAAITLLLLLIKPLDAAYRLLR